MRLLHVIPSLGAGGAETQLFYLSQNLADRGHEVHIACYSHIEQAERIPTGVIMHHIKGTSNYDLRLLLQMLKITKVIEPQILHSWSVAVDILGGICSKICNSRWIIREPSSHKAYEQTNFKFHLREFLAKYADCIVANSAPGRAYWIEKIPGMNTEVIANGLPLETCKNTPADRSVLPNSLRLPETPLIIYAGRLTNDVSARKNVDRLLKSLKLIEKQDVGCVICGDGPAKQDLINLCNFLQISDRVFFAGNLPQDKLWQLIKASAGFVSLSSFEGHPNTVLEAMACGCPLILSDIEAHRLLLDEHGAIFVDPENEKAVASAILSTLNDQHMARTRANNASKIVQKFSIAEMTDKYEELYQSLLCP